jgi:rubrerythrin
MRDFSDLDTAELLTLGRRALELGARRIEEIADMADPGDQSLLELLRKMSLDAQIQAAAVEQLENLLPEDPAISAKPEEGLRLIRSYLTSLAKSLGEGPVHRDIALFLAESLEEETSRLCRVLASHAREGRARNVFADLADREQGNFRYLRDVVLQ